MKRLSLLGLTIIAILSVGALAAASALATERGVLALEKNEESITMTGEGENNPNWKHQNPNSQSYAPESTQPLRSPNPDRHTSI